MGMECVTHSVYVLMLLYRYTQQLQHVSQIERMCERDKANFMTCWNIFIFTTAIFLDFHL